MTSKPQLATLATLCTSVDYGHTAAAEWRPVGPRFLRITDIQDGAVDWSTVPYCTCTEAEETSSSLVPGDILFARTGATTGKSFMIRNCPDRAVFASYLIRIRPNESLVDASYLAHFFQTQDYWSQIKSNARGATLPGVNSTVLKTLSIPLVPLDEQRRIAAILDKADALRQKRRAAFQKLDSLTQSLFLDMFGDPVANLRGWPRVPFSDLLQSIDSGNSPVCLDRPATLHEWGVLKLGAVTKCEFNDREQKALPQSVRIQHDLEVKCGDLLFSRKNTRDLVAACALVRQTRPRLLIPDLIFRFVLRSDAPVEKEFLHQLLISPPKRKEIQKLAGGSAGSMPNISKHNLSQVEIELPPIVLQKQFAVRVNVIQGLMNRLRNSAQANEAVFRALQHRAFRGEL